MEIVLNGLGDTRANWLEYDPTSNRQGSVRGAHPPNWARACLFARGAMGCVRNICPGVPDKGDNQRQYNAGGLNLAHMYGTPGNYKFVVRGVEKPDDDTNEPWLTPDRPPPTMDQWTHAAAQDVFDGRPVEKDGTIVPRPVPDDAHLGQVGGAWLSKEYAQFAEFSEADGNAGDGAEEE